MTARELASGAAPDGSAHEAVDRAGGAVDPAGEAVEAVLHDGLERLHHFDPDDDREGEPLHPAVVELRELLGAAGALLFSTPEYAGALPGSFKNLLDWTVGGGETYGMPVAWLNVAGPAAPTAAAGAHAELRAVLGYTRTAARIRSPSEARPNVPNTCSFRSPLPANPLMPPRAARMRFPAGSSSSTRSNGRRPPIPVARC